MIRTIFKIKYGFKDFQHHMGISSNTTIMGMLRRTFRKHPKIAKALKTITIMGSLYFVMMNFIPGSNLPFQKSIKISVFSFSQIFSKAWTYNFFNPDPETYLIRINQILLAAIDRQVFDLKFITSTLKEVREIYQLEKKQMTKNVFWDIIIYSEIVLQNIVRYQKKLLLQKDIFIHYQWLFAQMTTQHAELSLSQKQNAHLNLILTVIQYLINFGDQTSKRKTIHQFHSLINSEINSQPSRIALKIIQASILNKRFIQSLKTIYINTAQQPLKEQIINIFDRIDTIYNSTLAQSKPQPQ